MKITGLTNQEVIESRKKHGMNSINQKNKDTFFHLLLETLGDPIIKILLIALGIKTIFLFKDFDWFETLGIVLAILIASLISSISEYGSAKAFEKLQDESSKIKVKVKRNNKIEEISIEEIVIDDLVVLNSGDKIPADGIVIEGNLTIDESVMNGETKEKYKESIINPNLILEKNMLYRGTIINEGNAIMLVIKIGNNTLYGKLASELQEKSTPSPLKLRLTSLAKFISKIGYIGSFLGAISYLFCKIILDNNFNAELIINTITNFPLMLSYILHALTLSVTIIIVAVPEGLPMMITLVLSSNMKKMLKNNVLVRKLVGIETAGSLNILFTDKTGTLTYGKLEVVGLLSSTMNEYKNLSELNSYVKYKNILIDSLIYNNDSSYNIQENKIIGGNTTDKALLNFVKINKDNHTKIISKTPFTSKNKYAVTVIEKNAQKLKLIKGASEIVLSNCNYYLDENGNQKILINKRKIENKLNSITQKGIRVLALAINQNKYLVDNLKGSTLLGFILIKDEVRKDAIEGINLVKKAHIQTVMMTGDNKQTALAVAKEVGLVTSSDDLIMTSDDLKTMSDKEIKQILPKIKVIARSLPQDKSRLVNIAKGLNLVVGMTGDGVNDAPALKRADVGIAMGSGTEVSKEASDIVILDDNFLSISNAILYGRTIFKSIRKFIVFQLTVNLCALTISIIGPFIGIAIPITVIQMLWINMVMDTLAGLAFSYEPALKEYMNEFPKKKDEQIINKYMINEILVTGLYSALLCIFFLKSEFVRNIYRVSADYAYLMTAFFGLFIFISLFNSFNARTHRLNIFAHLRNNKAFLAVITFIMIVQISLIYLGGTLFRTTGLNIKEFIVMILISLTVIPFDFIRKIYLKKKQENLGV